MRILIALLAASVAFGQAKPQLEKAEIEKIVREYIMQHPEVVIDSLRAFQARAQLEAQQKAMDAVKARQAELFKGAAEPAIGPSEGKPADAVTVAVFFDYRCGYCRRVNPTILKVAQDNKNVRFVFKEFPILGPDSVLGAKAALAAHKQGGYLKFHEALIAQTGNITQESIDELAEKQGLNKDKLKADMASPEIAAAIAKNQELAEALGIGSTPTFVAGTQVVAGAQDIAGFNQMIAKAREEKDSKGPQ